MLSYHENQCQQRVNDVWSCILGNQSIERILELITEQLTAFICKNTTYKRKITELKIIDITNCNTCTKILLDVEYAILMIYYYQTAKRRALYASTHGPADNLPNSDWFRDFHQTISELTDPVYWPPMPTIWYRFGFDMEPDLKWPSWTVANTRADPESFWYIPPKLWVMDTTILQDVMLFW